MATIETPQASILACVIREVDAENPEIDNHELTDIVIEALGDDGDVLETVRPALTEFARQVRREKPRRRERKLRGKWNPSKHGEEQAAAMQELAEEMAAYANEYVDIPSRGRVRAGEVTIPEWQERIEALQDGIARDQETVNFYDDVVEELESNGAESIDAYLAN